MVPNLYEYLCSTEHKVRIFKIYSEECEEQISSGAPLTSMVFFIPSMEVNSAPKQPVSNFLQNILCIFSQALMWKHPLSLRNDPVHRDSGYLCAAVYEGWFISWLQLCTEWSEHWVVFWQHGWISQWLSATQQANWTQAMLSAAFLKCGQSDFREGMIRFLLS